MDALQHNICFEVFTNGCVPAVALHVLVQISFIEDKCSYGLVVLMENSDYSNLDSNFEPQQSPRAFCQAISNFKIFIITYCYNYVIITRPRQGRQKYLWPVPLFSMFLCNSGETVEHAGNGPFCKKTSQRDCSHQAKGGGLAIF